MSVYVKSDATDQAGAVPLDAAARLYRVSREVYAPVLAAFADHCLSAMESDPRRINLCLARDGIGAYLAQTVLLRAAPVRYPGVCPRQIRLAYISRRLIATSEVLPPQRRMLHAYLRRQGLCRTTRLTLVDVGIHGRIQDGLRRLYPARELCGEYLILRRHRLDPNAPFKHGFLVERGAVVPSPGAVALATSGDGYFLRRDVIHLLEDLWSGVHESVTHLRPVRAPRALGSARPVLCRLGERESLERSGPAPAQMLALKRAALRGVVDGVACVAGRVFARQGRAARHRRAPVDELAPAAARLAGWIQSTRDPASPDAWVWRALVRPTDAETQPG
jgi:hypothetical protein